MTHNTLEDRIRKAHKDYKGVLQDDVIEKSIKWHLNFIKSEIASAVEEIGLDERDCNHEIKYCGCNDWNYARVTIENQKQSLLYKLK